ncbi:uncharacterized protein EDB93DRAFT_1254428 [Suillus bovinus]|uniref:uncharacterized protein n=1 Tax=Suillus bovinus TaxID=48563 RepID=UPI001B85F299|nr:uncharacterized protein EDB93DRAFT_1254428 [Suillus bovinus]KAG2134926.1 hypothetical protein EDB93DRAFT_1254428 [Suillus bovinus]
MITSRSSNIPVLQQQAEWWSGRRSSQTLESTADQEGLAAYACRQAALWLSLVASFQDLWKDVPMFVSAALDIPPDSDTKDEPTIDTQPQFCPNTARSQGTRLKSQGTDYIEICKIENAENAENGLFIFYTQPIRGLYSPLRVFNTSLPQLLVEPQGLMSATGYEP